MVRRAGGRGGGVVSLISSPVRRYISARHAVEVLWLLGYKRVNRDDSFSPREWRNKEGNPTKVTVDVRGPYPHRTVVRAKAEASVD